MPSQQSDRAVWILYLTGVALTPLVTAAAFDGTRLAVAHSFLFPQNLVLALSCAVTTIAWVLTQHKGSATQVTLSRPLFIVIACVLAAVTSTVFAYEPVRAWLGSAESALSLIRIISLALLFFLTHQLVDSRQRLVTLTRVVVGCGGVVAVIALLQQFGSVDLLGTDTPAAWYLSRGFGTLGNPDFLGTFLVAPTVLAFASVIFERSQRWSMFSAVMTVMISVALINTLTRGAWGGLALSLLFALALSGRTLFDTTLRRRSGFAIAALALGFVLALSNWGLDGFGERLQIDPGPGRTLTTSGQAANALLSGRLEMWRVATAAIIDRPVIGTGPASFEYAWFTHAQSPSSAGGSNDVERDPHSLPLFLASTLGLPSALIGLLLFGFTLIAASRMGFRRIRRDPAEFGVGHHAAWTAATAGLGVATTVAAVTTPILALFVVALAVLARTSCATRATALVGSQRITVLVLAVALSIMSLPPLALQLVAEQAVAGTAHTADFTRADRWSAWVPWDIDVQKAYFRMRALRVENDYKNGAPDAAQRLERLKADLDSAASEYPRELYYPAVKAQVFTNVGVVSRDRGHAEAAIAAADAALMIMPASIPVRINRALALSYLERYEEMAATLSGWWMNERSSSYPGVLYAQALALSGDAEGCWKVFDRVMAMFPNDASLPATRTHIENLLVE